MVRIKLFLADRPKTLKIDEINSKNCIKHAYRLVASCHTENRIRDFSRMLFFCLSPNYDYARGKNPRARREHSRRRFPYRAASALDAGDDEQIGEQEQGPLLPRALIRRYGDQIVPYKSPAAEGEGGKKKGGRVTSIRWIFLPRRGQFPPRHASLSVIDTPIPTAK